MISMRSASGEPTGAIRGVVSMLQKLKADFPSDYIAAVFDPKGKTFRDAIYPQYKATRQAMPEDLAQQVVHLFDRPEESASMGKAARSVVEQNQGALHATADAIDRVLASTYSSKTSSLSHDPFPLMAGR